MLYLSQFMNKVFRYLEKVDTHPLVLVSMAFMLFISLFTIRYPYLSLPLIGDEWYYADPRVFKGLSMWTNISFGHPPLWNFLCGIFYTLFDYSPTIAHFIGITSSLISSMAIFFCHRQICWNIPFIIHRLDYCSSRLFS